MTLTSFLLSSWKKKDCANWSTECTLISIQLAWLINFDLLVEPIKCIYLGNTELYYYKISTTAYNIEHMENRVSPDSNSLLHKSLIFKCFHSIKLNFQLAAIYLFLFFFFVHVEFFLYEYVKWIWFCHDSIVSSCVEKKISLSLMSKGQQRQEKKLLVLLYCFLYKSPFGWL